MRKGSSENRICSVPGCDKKHYGRGYCSGHYSRLRTGGDVAPGKTLKPKLEYGKLEAKICIISGCGELHRAKGYCKSHYVRLLKHGDVLPQKPLRCGWGERRIGSSGYVVINGVSEHVLIAERALGRKLRPPEEVHHVNEIKIDNRPENLVICQDEKYHLLLHRRARALRACEHANWRKCNICKKYDSPGNLYINPNERSAHHRACMNAYKNNIKHIGKEQILWGFQK